MHFKSKKGTTDPVLSFRQAISLPYKYCKTDHDVPTHDLFALMCAVAVVVLILRPCLQERRLPLVLAGGSKICLQTKTHS